MRVRPRIEELRIARPRNGIVAYIPIKNRSVARVKTYVLIPTKFDGKNDRHTKKGTCATST